jgi:arylsulfatase A-like enzyme
MDQQFGRIIGVLDQAGQLGNTLVLFHSDNGGPERHAANNRPLRDGKGSYYDGGLRVPAFAFWPSRIQPGRTTAFNSRLDALHRSAPPAFWRQGDGTTPQGWRSPAIIGPDQPAP